MFVCGVSIWSNGGTQNTRSRHFEKDGRTPLICAADNGHADCVRLLIDAGADMEIKDGQVYTCRRCSHWLDRDFASVCVCVCVCVCPNAMKCSVSVFLGVAYGTCYAHRVFWISVAEQCSIVNVTTCAIHIAFLSRFTKFALDCSMDGRR